MSASKWARGPLVEVYGDRAVGDLPCTMTTCRNWNNWILGTTRLHQHRTALLSCRQPRGYQLPYLEQWGCWDNVAEDNIIKTYEAYHYASPAAIAAFEANVVGFKYRDVVPQAAVIETKDAVRFLSVTFCFFRNRALLKSLSSSYLRLHKI